jgi:hypothetical protein
MLKKLMKFKGDDQESKSYVINTQSSLKDNYLLNFREDRFRSGYYDEDDDISEGENVINTTKTKQQKTFKIAVNAIDVLNELERVPTNWSLEGLDDKIAILKDKADLIVQKHAKKEVEALKQCLENRKKIRYQR